MQSGILCFGKGVRREVKGVSRSPLGYGKGGNGGGGGGGGGANPTA